MCARYLQLLDKTHIENNFILIDNVMFYVTLRWSGLIVLRREAQPCPVFKDESVSYKNGLKSLTQRSPLVLNLPIEELDELLARGPAHHDHAPGPADSGHAAPVLHLHRQITFRYDMNMTYENIMHIIYACTMYIS